MSIQDGFNLWVGKALADAYMAIAFILIAVAFYSPLPAMNGSGSTQTHFEASSYLSQTHPGISAGDGERFDVCCGQDKPQGERQNPSRMHSGSRCTPA